jgi:hypothetical protein
MPPRRATPVPTPGIARHFEPSRLAGQLLNSAYGVLVPATRLTPGTGATRVRSATQGADPRRPAVGA